MAIVISRVGVDWGEAFFGYVPSHTIIESGALYTGMLSSLPRSLHSRSLLTILQPSEL